MGSVRDVSFKDITQPVAAEQDLLLGKMDARERAAGSIDGARSGPDAEGFRDEFEQGQESSGNNASNGTTQKLEKAEEAAAEASTGPKSPGDDLQELASKGLCAPLWRTAKPSQSGVGVPDVEQLQTGWCNYRGVAATQRGSIWLASNSPSVQARAASHAMGPSPAAHQYSGGRTPSASRHQVKDELPERSNPETAHGDPGVFTARPPAAALPALPLSPFSRSAAPSPFGAGRDGSGGAALQHIVSGDSPFSPSAQSKFQWPEDAHSPRQSHSDGEHRAEPAANATLTRQVSLPDFGELADLWTEMSNMPDDYTLDLEALPSLPKLGSLQPLSGNMSAGFRQASLAKMAKGQDLQTPVGSLLNDIKSQRRSRSMKISTALTWQPGLGLDGPLPQPRRSSGKLHGLQMGPPIRDTLAVADRTSSSGFHSSGEGSRPRGPELPDQVQLSIVSAPSIFAVPTCINKTFKPPFSVRVTITSSVKTQIKATVAAYTLQREQVAKLDQWHPSQHIFTESLSGSIITEAISCDGPKNSKTGAMFPGKHVGVGDLTFTDLKFNASSRMKPRWIVFALALPSDDVIFAQYTVPTIVMSRQCDQTPRALAILRGEVPTRKRARQNDVPEAPRAKALCAGLPPALGGSGAAPPPQLGLPGFLAAPQPAPRRVGPQVADQGSINLGGFYEDETDWPQQGPFTMGRWREAIVKVCRLFGLTRSFEQEDMHELAKVAGFMGNPQTGSQQTNVLTLHQWNAFGRWFLSYLHIFKDHRDLWMSQSVVCICGFSVTRERAEQLLAAQPDGTFLLRPSLSMDSTIVISVASGGRVFHLAVDAHQLETRTVEDWVRELPDIAFLLDINSGVRYPKAHVFRSRRPAMMPPTPGLLGLQGGMMPSFGGPSINPGGMMPSAHAQGQDALAHILEASRRSADSFSPTMSTFGHASLPHGHGPGHAGGDSLGQLFDQWGQMDLHDPYRTHQLDPQAAARAMHPSHGHMRFGGH